MTRRNFLATAAAAGIAGAAPARTAMGFSPDCFTITRPPRTPIEYMELAYERGAGGIQAMLPPNVTPEYLKKLRQRKEELNMYLEITTALPKEGGEDQFEATIKAAKECGAWALRSVCLGGRRYETFNTMEQWQAFVKDSHARLDRARRILERQKFPMGLENHKDWTVEEMVPLMQKYHGEYLGICYDWGNNMSLLDDPMEATEAFAPYIMTNHIKDMAVEEYEDGFLLAEVPLGTGMFDLKKMLEIILKHRPKTTFSLDMLTRDPLKITCLTEKYWVTYTHRHGRYLAHMLSLVRKNKPKQPIPRVTGADRATQVQLETDNVGKSVAYARDVLGLRI